MSVKGLRVRQRSSHFLRHSPLKSQSDEVDDEDPAGESETCGGLEPEGSADVREERADVHGIVEDVEGETSDSVAHQDAKVVAEVGSCEFQRCISSLDIPVTPRAHMEEMTKIWPEANRTAARSLTSGLSSSAAAGWSLTASR
jgi:hypothetical protein